jgi:hypothetical protein
MTRVKEHQKPIREIPAEAPISTAKEQKRVEERVAIGPHIVYEAIRREGEEELDRASAALAWSGIAAGLWGSPSSPRPCSKRAFPTSPGGR